MYAHPQQDSTYDVRALRQQAGRWLRQLRERQGLSQRGLADLVSVEYYSFISQLETGRGRVPPERYAQWAHALGLEPAEFVKGLMRYYDPITYGILFEDDETGQLGLGGSPNERDHNDGA